HRLLLLTGLLHSAFEITFTEQDGEWPPVSRTHRHILTNAPMLQGGAEFARVIPLMTSPKVNVDAKPVIDIAFAEPKIVESKPVIPLLHQLTHLVDGVVSQFI